MRQPARLTHQGTSLVAQALYQSGVKTEGKRRGWQRMKIDSIINSMEMNLSKIWEIAKDREAWHAAVHVGRRVRHDLATEQH